MSRDAFGFTGRETWQLVASTLVLAAAFSFALTCSYLAFDLLGSCGEPGIAWSTFLFPALPVSIVIVLAAFVLHELAHKLVAQYYGMWAEFRSSTTGLLVALAISGALGVVVASPGAVLIYPPARPRPAFYETEEAFEQAVAEYEDELGRHSGIISVAGPLVNIAFSLVAWPLWLATDQNPAFDVGVANVGNFFQLALLINVVLAAFNMIPIKPLDGSKIIRWNWGVFVLVWLTIIGLFWALVGGL